MTSAGAVPEGGIAMLDLLILLLVLLGFDAEETPVLQAGPEIVHDG